jgi:hypothetical protein
MTFGSLVALSKSIANRLTTNLLTWSDPTAVDVTNFPANSGVTYAAGGVPGFTGSVAFVQSAGTIFAYKRATLPVDNHTLTVFLKMDDGGVPVIGNSVSSAADFALTFEGNSLTGATIVPIGNSVYRVSRTVSAVGTVNANFGIAKYATQSARGFKVSGYQLELGSFSVYVPTTTTPVTASVAKMISVQYGDPTLASISLFENRK